MNHDHVHVEIQKVLSSINEITLKIGRELHAINELSSENGPLNIAIDSANVTLKNAIRESGIMISSHNDEDVDNESEDLRIPAPLSDITEKLNALMHNGKS